MSVLVTYDPAIAPAEGPIRVTDSKAPKASPVVWSKDMWETSVWERVTQGKLPALAREEGVESDPFDMQLPTWGGGAVVWGRLRFTAEEWQGFVDRMESGELSVEALAG